MLIHFESKVEGEVCRYPRAHRFVFGSLFIKRGESLFRGYDLIHKISKTRVVFPQGLPFQQWFYSVSVFIPESPEYRPFVGRFWVGSAPLTLEKCIVLKRIRRLVPLAFLWFLGIDHACDQAPSHGDDDVGCSAIR
jgi:hypothetical protein